MRYQYDLAIIGGGSAGLTAAYAASAFGARVILIDKERFGGDCLYSGCVPSKSLIHVARLIQQTRAATQFGQASTPFIIDMHKVSAHIQKIIHTIHEAENAFTKDVTSAFGEVVFASPTTLLLDGKPITCRNTIIATGSAPHIPAIPGLQATGFLTNDDVFNLTTLPRSFAIIGGGPIGTELGQALTRLGAQVTILHNKSLLLPKEDEPVSTLITEVLEQEGVTLIKDAYVQEVIFANGKKVVVAKQDEKMHRIEVEEIIVATGRRPEVKGLKLENAGIIYTEKGIQVNQHLQTTAPNIYAAGDVIGGYYFSHIATYQAGVAVRNALIPIAKQKVDYTTASWCTFTDPEVAHAGLTECEARQQYKRVRTVTHPLAKVDRAQTENAPTGFITLILAGGNDKIVGANIVGIRAGEMISEIILAMTHKLSLNDIVNTIHVYPTMNSGIQQTVFQAYLHGTSVKALRPLVRTILTLRR